MAFSKVQIRLLALNRPLESREGRWFLNELSLFNPTPVNRLDKDFWLMGGQGNHFASCFAETNDWRARPPSTEPVTGILAILLGKM